MFINIFCNVKWSEMAMIGLKYHLWHFEGYFVCFSDNLTCTRDGNEKNIFKSKNSLKIVKQYGGSFFQAQAM